MRACEHCHRPIILASGVWVDPEATGDDAVWRETCDSHDTFTAEHEPEARHCAICGELESGIPAFQGLHRYGPLDHDFKPREDV